MYDQIKIQIWNPVDVSGFFEVNLGVYQGSVLEPFFFRLVMEYLVKDIQELLPLSLLYADIVLVANTSRQLQEILL